MTSYNKDLLDIDFGEFQSANSKPEKNINETIPDSEPEEENDNIRIGEKHQSKIGNFYDIEISKTFTFIKLYNANRNIDTERTKTMVKKYKTKTINFPPLIIAHIVDKEIGKDEYVLIDGQHRYYCMKQLLIEHNIDTMFTYKLYDCSSLDELEQLFVDINCNIKFENMFPYKSIGKLIDRLEVHFKHSVSKKQHNRNYKFNPDKLKVKLVELKFFETYDNTVDEVFDKIIELNTKTGEEYLKKKAQKKLFKWQLTLLEHIQNAKNNIMYLLLIEDFESFEWLDELTKLL
jgi:hypothetical protein